MPSLDTTPRPALHALRKLGRDLSIARRKRGISTQDMASRLFVSRATLWRLERGDSKVAIGTGGRHIKNRIARYWVRKFVKTGPIDDRFAT